MDDEERLRRRIKAARELAGLRVEDLAKKINSARLGAKALGSIERGDRKTPPQPHEIAAIASACELPIEFFSVDFNDLPSLISTARLVESGDLQPPGEALAPPALVEIVGDLGRRIASLEASLSDPTRVAVEEARLATAAALETAGVGGSTQPAETARDEAGASAEEPRAPDRETPRTEPGAAG